MSQSSFGVNVDDEIDEGHDSEPNFQVISANTHAIIKGFLEGFIENVVAKYLTL